MKNLKKTIFITGAAGFIGKNLCDYLQKKNYQIRAMVRSDNFPKELVGKNIEIVFGDITDLKTLIKLTKNTDIVVNLAVRKSDEKDSFEVNVQGVQNLLKACEVNEVNKFIQLSTISAKIPKKGTYGKTKERADQVIIKSSINYVILRVSLIYGNKSEGIFASLIKAARLPVIPVFGDGSWVSNPIYINDLSSIIEKIIDSKKLKNQIWDIGGNDPLSFDNLIKKIALTRNKKPFIVHIPNSLGLLIAKLLSFLVKNPPITVSNILGSTQNVPLDVQKYQKYLRMTPVPLDEGLRISLYKEEKKSKREAEVIINYILSASNINYIPEKILLNNYEKLLRTNFKDSNDKFSSLIIKYPFLLGSIEIFLKFFYQDAILLKKIHILTALLECNPVTANWMLPAERSKSELYWVASQLILKMLIKYLVALLLFPSLFLYANKQK